MLHVTALVAFVGITILELIVIWAVGIFRRESASHLDLTAMRSPRGQGDVDRVKSLSDDGCGDP